MNEDAKKQVAVFRFGVICDLVNGSDANNGEKERLLREKCARKWQIPFSVRTHISRSTILRWVRLYQRGNGKLESLYPTDRSDRRRCRAMDADTCKALVSLRKENPNLPVPHLIEKMQTLNLVTGGITLNRSTVYRFLHQQALMHPAPKESRDCRKFEAELPNDLWQSDVMHGPMVVKKDGKLRKSYLIAFIDDHSRLVPHACFYLSERLESYMDAFQKALLKRGLPRKLYVDNGPAFRSRHLEYVTAALGIALVHSKPYQPRGRGKIERFFKTVRSSFLTGFKGETLDDLNAAFENWLEAYYHSHQHGGTAQTPFKRFTAHMECLRSAPENLREYFRQVARRRVAKDRTITLNGRLYEGPVELIGCQVELLYHADEPEQVEIRYQQKSHGLLRPVDLHVNCRVKRNKNRKAEMQAETSAKQHYQGGSLLSGAKEAKA